MNITKQQATPGETKPKSADRVLKNLTQKNRKWTYRKEEQSITRSAAAKHPNSTKKNNHRKGNRLKMPGTAPPSKKYSPKKKSEGSKKTKSTGLLAPD